MSITPNYGWNLPDWEMSSGQNAALADIDTKLKTVSDATVLSTSVLTPATTTLVAGSSVVANTTVTTANKIIYSRTAAGAGALGNLSYAIIDNTSITFTSDAVTDISTIAYIIL